MSFGKEEFNHMHRRLPWLVALLVTTSLTTYAQQPTAPKTHLRAGQPAPDFTLTDTEGREVKLSDFKGKRSVVLAFYVLAFTGG